MPNLCSRMSVNTAHNKIIKLVMWFFILNFVDGDGKSQCQKEGCDFHPV